MLFPLVFNDNDGGDSPNGSLSVVRRGVDSPPTRLWYHFGLNSDMVGNRGTDEDQTNHKGKTTGKNTHNGTVAALTGILDDSVDRKLSRPYYDARLTPQPCKEVMHAADTHADVQRGEG